MGTIDTQNNERRLRARFVHRAIETAAPLLATALHRYATTEGMTWAELAQSLDCSIDALNQIAICRPPRPEHFVADVEAIAADYIDVDRLLPLLRRLQVIAAFVEHAVRTSEQQQTKQERVTLLAARDRENEQEGHLPATPAHDQPSPATETDDV
jgi:hypothetical protein